MKEQPITIELDREVFEAGEALTGRYRVEFDDTEAERIVELAVYWCSEGKGDEDRAVQFQEQRLILPGELSDPSNGEFSVPLPLSPLSYDGVLIKIIWYVAVEYKPARGQRSELQVPFQLGHVAPVAEVTP